MPGYSPTILSEEDRDEKFLCVDCSMLLKAPLQSFCGHRFCKNCIDEKLRQGQNYECPKCVIEDPTEDCTLTMEKVFPDRAMQREMRELKTKCINVGCGWNGLFPRYETHEPVCEYRLVECTRVGCFDKIRSLDMTSHLDKECVMRIEKCTYCKKAVIFKEMQTHINECPMYPVACTNCGQEIIRKRMTEHLDLSTGDCPRKMQVCEYYKVGCKAWIDVGMQMVHNSVAIEDHMSLILQETMRINRYRENVGENSLHLRQLIVTANEHGTLLENLRLQVDRLKNDLKHLPTLAGSQIPEGGLQRKFLEMQEKLGKSTDDMVKKSDGLGRRVVTYEGIVAVLNGEVERNAEIVQRMNSQEKDFRENLNGMERKTKAQDRIIALKDVTLAEQDLRIQSLEMATYDGILTWRITGFARKRRDAISGRTLSIYSPYFFTSRYGYKMCARIYLNGDGMGKGSHVSLFFVIMKGEHDAILKWPFNQKVTFMFIDQSNREHMIDAFRPDPESSSFKRPTGDMNIASGCPLFMALSLLDSGNQTFVKDDTAFLRIIVDTSDI
ncbi:TNF receptor-associated factor 2-like [Glandiceps talaboti]